MKKLLVSLLLVLALGCASRTIQDVADEEGVEVSVELRYFGAVADYNSFKSDALAYALLPSTTAGEVELILLVINGGTSDAGCLPTSIEPRCLDGADGALRAFEALRRIGEATPSSYEGISFALATAAASIRTATGEQ